MLRAPIGISERSILTTTLRRLGEASRRLIRLWFEMHYFAHLVVCRIGRIQPSDPLLPTFYVGKELPVSRTTTVADPVKVGGRQDFQSGWRGVVLDAIELAQIIAITDLCDNLTCFRAFLVNKVQTNEVGWLMVFDLAMNCVTPCAGLVYRVNKPMSSADVIRIARPHQDTYRPRALLASGIRKERQKNHG